MIILKHLTIERFRLLRALNLHFPQRGSILIQGPNEAGKSALIESIYFSLYGEPLISKRSKRPLDDLILYGASTAHVELVLSVGATELTIARTIERGQGQRVSLQISRLGVPEEEPITQLAAANARIIAEIGQMSGETLRNACLIEQKGLDRLETLPGAERETTARKLLGLEKLLRLSEQFQVQGQDEQDLIDSSEHLQLAEIQARIPQLHEQLKTIETALDAVSVAEALANIEQQENEIAELEQTLEHIQTRRLELRSRQGRVSQLRKADATLAEIISSYEDMAEARRELPELEKQLAELQRREEEELPGLERRVEELSELTRSFGTLQRMSNDLLTAVDTIKELEADLKSYTETRHDLELLNEQVGHARSRLQEAQQALHDLEEQRRIGRPQLEARLQRLTNLAERLDVLKQLETRYTQRLVSRSLAEENATHLKKVQKDLRDTEQELALVEQEARQAQQQAEVLERTWRQLSIRRQMEEWNRLQGLAQGLSNAEQHVRQAHQHQSKLTQAVIEARNSVRNYLILLGVCVVLIIVCLVVAISNLGSLPWLSVIFLLAMAATAFFAWANFNKYRKATEEEKSADRLLQEALSRVGMMVAAREAAVRMSGNTEALHQVENEIRSLGGTIPRSLEEAQQFLDQTRDQGDLGEVQQRMKEKIDSVNAARNQVNVTMEAVAALRKERSQLEEQRRREHWDDIEENLLVDQVAVERMQQEITLLAGQEGLPIPSINARIQASPVVSTDNFSSGALPPVVEEDMTGIPDLESLVDSTIRATEHELASLEGKLDMIADLSAQTKVYQEALDTLLVRQSGIEERTSRYRNSTPEQQLERAREQQLALRSALQSLQDSLRARVKPLRVSFGQAAISNAETQARKQLEELHITLGQKVMLQERRAHYGEVLRDRQESLSEHYKQLAKFSNTLGSWIVPLNPFAEALVALRTRCQQELDEANEAGILDEMDTLQREEAASRTKITLCTQEIGQLQGSIAALFKKRGLPKPKSSSAADLAMLWPLLQQYRAEDRSRLQEERAATEQELSHLEQQEQQWSEKLGTGNTQLDLAEARQRREQAERSYQTKKRGNQLVKAVEQRLLRKVVPRTEYFMQQILPALTGGRYHDVHLFTEAEEGTISGGPFQVQVWDTAADDYIPSSVLSGGAADQLSLALRLAFAIATLPRELSAAPGFILLDEPLSSFDRGRTQALVNVVTGELLSQHFEQIILVSHSSAFDPAMFPYHLYMDNGLIIESNLPVVPNSVIPDTEPDSGTLIPITAGNSVDASYHN